MQDMYLFLHLSIILQLSVHILKLWVIILIFFLSSFMWHGYLIINCLEQGLPLIIHMPTTKHNRGPRLLDVADAPNNNCR